MNWQLASALYVWQIDVDGLGRDALGAVNQLAGLLPAGHAAADDTLTHLAMAAEEWGPRGAVIDGAETAVDAGAARYRKLVPRCYVGWLA